MGTSEREDRPLRDALREASEAARDVRSDVQRLEAALEKVADAGHDVRQLREVVQPAEPSWRERLWTAPADCRLGIEELSEALGKGRDWIYRRTQSKAENRLPHRKLSGALSFRVGEVRTWVRDSETVEVALPSTSSEHERGMRLVEGGSK